MLSGCLHYHLEGIPSEIWVTTCKSTIGVEHSEAESTGNISNTNMGESSIYQGTRKYSCSNFGLSSPPSPCMLGHNMSWYWRGRERTVEGKFHKTIMWLWDQPSSIMLRKKPQELLVTTCYLIIAGNGNSSWARHRADCDFLCSSTIFFKEEESILRWGKFAPLQIMYILHYDTTKPVTRYSYVHCRMRYRAYTAGQLLVKSVSEYHWSVLNWQNKKKHWKEIFNEAWDRNH